MMNNNSFKISSFILLFTFLINLSLFAQKEKLTDYKFEEFIFQERNAIILFPDKPNKEKKWIWRARFFGTAPAVDLALLEKGFHLVYVDISGLYGNEKAVKIWSDFYFLMQDKYDLNKKVALEGMSRGALIVYNWASKNTEKIACIYVDAPVCDIKSWPGGFGKSEQNYMNWIFCLQAYGLNDKSVLEFKGNPINTCVSIAKAKIPVLQVYGDNDMLVPHTENAILIEKVFKENNHDIKSIIKKGFGHHPHGLENSNPIIDFILRSYL